MAVSVDDTDDRGSEAGKGRRWIHIESVEPLGWTGTKRRCPGVENDDPDITLFDQFFSCSDDRPSDRCTELPARHRQTANMAVVTGNDVDAVGCHEVGGGWRGR